jgi:hypothetical protein
MDDAQIIARHRRTERSTLWPEAVIYARFVHSEKKS